MYFFDNFLRQWFIVYIKDVIKGTKMVIRFYYIITADNLVFHSKNCFCIKKIYSMFLRQFTAFYTITVIR